MSKGHTNDKTVKIVFALGDFDETPIAMMEAGLDDTDKKA